MKVSANPFRIHGIVEDQYFTDRADELARIMRTLREPAAKLLVYGPRRMGKTSALSFAVKRIESEGGNAIMADISTASSLTDAGNRILAAVVRSLGRKWSDIATRLAERLRGRLTLTPDPATGLIVPSLDVSLRRADVEDQKTNLREVLDSLEKMARDRKTTLGVVLDEFQEIHKLGGDAAVWHLRGVIQEHQHVSYVLSGSATHLIERMTGPDQAFYGMLDLLHVGSIDTDHLAQWIDSRMTSAGVEAEGVGKRAIAVVGQRTRDIVQVARKCFDRARVKGAAGADDVDMAFREIVEEEGDLWQSRWERLTPHQQNVLRALAVSGGGLTRKATLDTFSLGSSGSATNSATALVEAGHLTKEGGRAGYRYDNPFFRGWVVLNTLADVGILPPEDLADSRQD